MNDSQRDTQDSKSNGVDHSQAQRAVRASNISLAEQRRSGRTLGFLGLSTVGHVAILVALASMPMAVHEINGGNSQPGHDGEISMIDSNSEAAASAVISSSAIRSPKETSTVEVSVMTDDSSEIAMSKAATPALKPEPKVQSAVVPLPEKKTVTEKKQPATTPVAKVAESAPVTPEPVLMEEAQDAPPVLLANPPSDDGQEVATAQAEPEPAPELVAEPQEDPQEEPAEEVDSVPEVAEVAPIPAKSESAKMAEAKTAEPSVEKSEESTPVGGAAIDAQKATAQQPGQNGQGQSGNQGAFAGPIRDASELKALSGNPNPVYPARDRLARKEGTAVILGRVSPEGRVVEATLEKSSGSANMDAASIQAFRGWRFQAGQQGWVRKPFQFRLVGDAREVPAPLGKGLRR
jgi:TonB family protein